MESHGPQRGAVLLGLGTKDPWAIAERPVKAFKRRLDREGNDQPTQATDLGVSAAKSLATISMSLHLEHRPLTIGV